MKILELFTKKAIEENSTNCTTAMEANKMKIFQTVRKNFASAGFVQEKGRFHTKQLLRILQGFLAMVSLSLYMAFDAVTVKDYMGSIFMTVVR